MELNSSEQASLESRRRFLKTGLVAAPLLVTLAARPAHAQEVVAGSLGSSTAGSAIEDDQFAPLGADDTDALGVL